MFKNQLRNLLIEKNISQKEIAQKLGLSIAEVNHWVTGRREIKVSDVLPICEVLGISPNRFFGLDEDISEQDRQLLQAFKAMAASTPNEAKDQNSIIQTPTQEKER